MMKQQDKNGTAAYEKTFGDLLPSAVADFCTHVFVFFLLAAWKLLVLCIFLFIKSIGNFLQFVNMLQFLIFYNQRIQKRNGPQMLRKREILMSTKQKVHYILETTQLHPKAIPGWHADDRKRGKYVHFFHRNPRGGRAKEIDPEDVRKFLELTEEYKFGKIVAHAP